MHKYAVIRTVPVFILIISIFIFNHSAFAQKDEFYKYIGQLKNTVVKVETSKMVYDARMGLLESSTVKYAVVKNSTRGTSKSLTYEINIAHIDHHTVRVSTERDLIRVDFQIKDSQKLIKVYEDDIAKSYTNELMIPAADIESARIIQEALVNAIPLAEQILENKIKLNSYEERLSWLETNIKDVQFENKTYLQTIKRDTKYKGKVLLTIIDYSKTSKTSEYSFNLADIDISLLDYKIMGAQFGLEVMTKKQSKLIKHTQDGMAKPFTDEILIKLNNVDAARDLKEVLADIIPEAEQLVNASLPKLEHLKPALSSTKENTININYGYESYEQSIGGQCLTQYKRHITSDSKSDDVAIDFNWKDVNDSLIDYKVLETKMFLTITANNESKVFGEIKNGERMSYEESFRIYCDDAENARRLQHAIRATIKQCQTHYKPHLPLGTNHQIKWLSTTISDVEIGSKKIKQVFKLTKETHHHKFTFTKTITSERGIEENIYEMSFADLNEENIDFKVSGKSITINLETNQEEKIIKHYKNGQIQNYENNFVIHTSEIDQTRNIVLVFKQIITHNKKK